MLVKLSLVIVFVSFFVIPIFAQEDKSDTEFTKAFNNLTDQDKKDLARVCFVVKGPKDNREWVVIRLTVEQYNKLKRVKLNRPVPMVLHLRQRLAIRHVLGDQVRSTKVGFLVSSRRVHECNRFPALFDKKFDISKRYIVRPKEFFTKVRDLSMDNKLGCRMEKEESGEQPDEKIFGGLLDQAVEKVEKDTGGSSDSGDKKEDKEDKKEESK